MRRTLASVSCRRVVDKHNLLTAGRRGPQLLQDVRTLPQGAHCDREVFAGRRMQAKGAAPSAPSLHGQPWHHALPAPYRAAGQGRARVT